MNIVASIVLILVFMIMGIRVSNVAIIPMLTTIVALYVEKKEMTNKYELLKRHINKHIERDSNVIQELEQMFRYYSYPLPELSKAYGSRDALLEILEIVNRLEKSD